MSSVSDSFRSDDYGAERHMRPRRQDGSRLQLVFAFAGMVSLGYMLWTIANLLG